MEESENKQVEKEEISTVYRGVVIFFETKRHKEIFERNSPQGKDQYLKNYCKKKRLLMVENKIREILAESELPIDEVGLILDALINRHKSDIDKLLHATSAKECYLTNEKMRWVRENMKEFVPPAKYFYVMGEVGCYMSSEEVEEKKATGEIDLSGEENKLYELEKEIDWIYQCTNGSTYCFTKCMIQEMSLKQIMDRCNRR